MRTVWHSLLWKEWREHRWKLVVLSMALLGILLLIMAGQARGRLIYVPELSFGVLYFYGLLVGMFMGMDLAAKENGVGTAAFLQMLPSPQWKAALAKLVIVSLVATVPVVLLGSVFFLLYRTGFFYHDDFGVFVGDALPELVASHVVGAWFARCTTLAVLTTLSLLWWMAAIGVNRSDEIRAGAMGFLGIVAIWLCFGYLLHLADKQELPNLEHALAVAASAAPGGPLFWQGYCAEKGTRFPAYDYPLPVFSIVGHLGVVVCFLLRFGRTTLRTGKAMDSLEMPAAYGSLKAPFRSQFSALVWKQIRETGPLAIMALAGIIAITGFVWWVDSQVPRALSETFLGVNAAMSFFVVIVAGLGLYLEEFKPNMSQFWRSRPTRIGLQFAIKYVAGILVLTTVLGLPALAVLAYDSPRFGGLKHRELLAAISFVGWFFVMAYSLAMTSYCLLRQPLYAAIFSVLAIWLGTVTFGRIFDQSHKNLEVTAMVLSLTGTIFVGWLALRNDWGWKR
jgi:hypothetical protein